MFGKYKKLEKRVAALEMVLQERQKKTGNVIVKIGGEEFARVAKKSCLSR